MPLIFLHLLFQIPAMITAGTAFRGIMPFEIDPKLVPLILVLSCLSVLYMPVTLALAFACALPVTIAYKYLGISLVNVIPFEIPESWRTLPWPRRTTHIEYQAAVPGTWTPDDDSEVEEDLPKKKSFIPDLP